MIWPEGQEEEMGLDFFREVFVFFGFFISISREGAREREKNGLCFVLFSSSFFYFSSQRREEGRRREREMGGYALFLSFEKRACNDFCFECQKKMRVGARAKGKKLFFTPPSSSFFLPPSSSLLLPPSPPPLSNSPAPRRSPSGLRTPPSSARCCAPRPGL